MKAIKLLTIVAAALLSVCSCATKQEISYEQGHNFYFLNQPSTNKVLKLTSKAQFEEYFGYSPVMGKNGEPTPIDFSRQMVIAKVLPVTDIHTEINPLGLKKTGAKELTLSYQIVREGGKMSWSMQPFFLLVVDKKYQNYIIKEKEM